MMSKRGSNKVVNTESHTVPPATVVDETGVPTQQDNFTNESEKVAERAWATWRERVACAIDSNRTREPFCFNGTSVWIYR